MDIAIFFPESGNYSEARNVCLACTVRQDCLEMALSTSDDQYGMFGGKTPKEREAIKWQRMRTR
jgi:WhiB family redox-sensing transcriptional regulator